MFIYQIVCVCVLLHAIMNKKQFIEKMQLNDLILSTTPQKIGLSITRFKYTTISANANLFLQNHTESQTANTRQSQKWKR